MWVTDAVLPLLKSGVGEGSEARATVVFVGSVGGSSQSVFPGRGVADEMSKAAVAQMAKHYAAMHVQSPIDIVCIAPGATRTPMFEASTLAGRSDGGAALIDALPKRSLIPPEDVAESIFFLSASAAGRMFHGAVLDASQGLAVRPGLLSELR